MNIIGHLCRIGAWHRKECSCGEEEIMFLPVFIIPLIAILIREKKSLMLQTLR